MLCYSDIGPLMQPACVGLRPLPAVTQHQQRKLTIPLPQCAIESWTFPFVPTPNFLFTEFSIRNTPFFYYPHFINFCILFHLREKRERRESEGRRRMADWGPVVIAVVLFVLLTPGLLFQLPGNSRAIEFANLQTSGVSIFVHTILFFGLITIFLIAIGVHITTG